MLKLLVLVLAVGLAYGAYQDNDNTFVTPEESNPFGLPFSKPAYAKEPCCAPDTWEGYMGEVVEYSKDHDEDADEDVDRHHHHDHDKHGRMMIMAKLAVDGAGKCVAMRMELHQKEGTSNVSITVDYTKHVLYIANYNKQQCRKVEVKEDMKKMCIPKDAKFFATVRFGAGDDSMNVDAWSGIIEQKSPVPMKVMAHMMVTPTTCVPVLEAGEGFSNGYKVSFHASFVNMETKISDPDIFTVPSFCKEAEEISAKVAAMDPHVASLLNRFSN